MNRLRNIRHLDPLPCPPQWVPTLGLLQRTLQKGEYLPLCPLPMFESNFVQVTSRGAPVYVHHRSNHLTMGVAASLPGPVLPDLLLIARPSEARDCSNLVLTRMIPLDLVHLYVHNLSAWRLKLCLVTGRDYYLELNAPDSEAAFLFDRWTRLIHLLQEPATFWAPRTLKTPLSDLAQMAPPASTWTLQNQSQCRRSALIVDPTFSYKMLTFQKRRKAKTLKRKLRSQAVGDSVPLIWSQLVQPGARKKATEKKSHPELGLQGSQTKIQVSGKPSITIRTIFSIVSSTINHKLSSSEDRPESEEAVVLGSLVKTPSYCISEDNPDISLLVSYDHMDIRRNMEELSDLESSTLSSGSLSQDSYCSSFYLPAPYSSSVRQHKKKARPPPSQKTPSSPPTSWEDPFILDQALRVSAVPAPSQKSPAGPFAPQKTPVPPAVSQNSPAIPGSSRKTPCVLAIPQKAPAIPSLSWKTPLVSGIPPKATPRPVPDQKSLFLSSPSPKAQTSPTRYQRTLDPADFGSLPRGRPVENVLQQSQPEGKTQPLVLVGTQETQVAEMWARKLPFRATQKETKGVVVSKAQEITLDGLKGKGKEEDKVHGMMEGKSLDLPGFKPRVMGQQQKRVKTRELAVERALQERRRPFSVKELTFAKMVILANSKGMPLKPELVGLPSWLLIPQVSARSTVGPESLNPSQATVLASTPVVDREAEKLLSDQRQSLKVPPRSKRGPSSPKTERISQVPIPLPSTRWEDAQSPILPNCIPKMEARVSQEPNRKSQETMGMPGQCPLATTGSSLDVLVPKLLEIETKRDLVNKVEKTKKKLSIFTPWPRGFSSKMPDLNLRR
ncbi:Golgi-associated RAB2 interactor protein 5B [Artibeus jamaicensis]|uniref:Golgi-associated RAB2 interactor protein 5B n=1 Tax=Artibeus jamaicensis TaxID=9417 RepID=UPI00235AFE35|nr:Golgi-associated RAB2 interactor protein 5B [Artibeus jamaicensis]